MKENKEQELQKLCNEIQQECQRTVEYIKAQNNLIDYQDATNVFFFRKLAELQVEINNLKPQLK